MKKLTKIIAGVMAIMLIGTSLAACGGKKLPDIVDENAPFTKDGSIKILTVGNSYGLDFGKYLYEILESTGRYTDIVVGNLYRGGCTLDQHYDGITKKTKQYFYFENATGEWEVTSSVNSNSIITSREWDVIVVQHASAYSYQEDSYGNLQNLVNEIKKLAPNAKLVYNSTWQPNNRSFLDQAAGLVKKIVEPMTDFKAIAMTGTVVESLRTAKLVPSLFRDGSHLDCGIACYSVSLLTMLKITGYNIEKISWTPEDQPEVKAYLSVIKTAVKAAMDDPYLPLDMTGTETNGKDYSKDADIMSDYGLDINNYTKTALELTKNKKYKIASEDLKASNLHYATQVFTKETLPVGSIIITNDVTTAVAVKWKNGSDGVEDPHPWNMCHFIVVDDAFWGEYTSCGFNVAHYSWELGSDYVDTNGISIYVPKK